MHAATQGHRSPQARAWLRDDAVDDDTQWAPSVLALPLAEAPMRPIVHLDAEPGGVRIDLVLDLPDQPTPSGWQLWARCTQWWRQRMR